MGQVHWLYLAVVRNLFVSRFYYASNMVEFYLFGRIVNLKDVHSGEVTVLYDAMKAISKLKTPVLEAPEVPIILKLRS